jgi:hypothetical protein
MKDLSFFICFILIFLCAFSITSWSLLTTPSEVKWFYDADGGLLNVTLPVEGSKSLRWQVIREIINYGIWKIFAEVDPIGRSVREHDVG